MSVDDRKSDIMEYLIKNGFELASKLKVVSSMIDITINEATGSLKSQVEEERSKLDPLTVENLNLKNEVMELKDKLENPSEVFRSWFIKCAKEYINLEDYISALGNLKYRLIIDGEQVS